MRFGTICIAINEVRKRRVFILDLVIIFKLDVYTI